MREKIQPCAVDPKMFSHLSIQIKRKDGEMILEVHISCVLR